MRCLNHTAFWFASIASSLFGFGAVLPFWLGRLVDQSVRLYGLWYQLQCQENSCSSFGLIFENDNVAGVYDFQLIVLPVSAIIAAVFSFIGVLVLQIQSCDCGRRPNCNPRPVIIFCTVMFWISVVSSGLALFVSIAVCSEFYDDDSIDHAGEFPWCTLMFGIGFLLMLVSAILYTVVICKWRTHGLFYGYYKDEWRTMDYANSVSYVSYKKNSSFHDRPNFNESVKRDYRESSKIPELGGVSSFMRFGHDSGYSKKSDYEKPKSGLDSPRFDFKLKGSKKASSTSDVRRSKQSIHDSPSLLRHMNASDFIRGERKSPRESRKLTKSASVDDLDPKRPETSSSSSSESRFDRTGSPKPSYHSQPSSRISTPILRRSRVRTPEPKRSKV